MIYYPIGVFAVINNLSNRVSAHVSSDPVLGKHAVDHVRSLDELAGLKSNNEKMRKGTFKARKANPKRAAEADKIKALWNNYKGGK